MNLLNVTEGVQQIKPSMPCSVRRARVTFHGKPETEDTQSSRQLSLILAGGHGTKSPAQRGLVLRH